MLWVLIFTIAGLLANLALLASGYHPFLPTLFVLADLCILVWIYKQYRDYISI